VLPARLSPHSEQNAAEVLSPFLESQKSHTIPILPVPQKETLIAVVCLVRVLLTGPVLCMWSADEPEDTPLHGPGTVTPLHGPQMNQNLIWPLILGVCHTVEAHCGHHNGAYGRLRS
jgi:hypothetical protein